MIAPTLRLDVRPILANGRDPFTEIMHVAHDVPENGVMVVVAPFDPVPLREHLRQCGFTSTVAACGPQEWEITFRRDATANAPSLTLRALPDAASGAAPARTWADAGGFHVDTRGLTEDSAIRAVLAALDRTCRGRTLVAHLDRNIDALYPELARRNCEAVFVPGNRAEVRLEISAAN